LIPSPIRKALSTIRRHQVAHLLMGGQACVWYGAAEFSRDLHLALLPDPSNLDRLQTALEELNAEVIAVPPFSLKLLTEGLAVHFRCRQPETAGLRIDVMAHMRGVAPFPELWARRTTFAFEDETLEVLALPDLVAAKKTQQDKDWPMSGDCGMRRMQNGAGTWRTGSHCESNSSVSAGKLGESNPTSTAYPSIPREALGWCLVFVTVLGRPRPGWVARS
jgi:hypothetical protein